jgi:flagellar protein FlgJ
MSVPVNYSGGPGQAAAVPAGPAATDRQTDDRTRIKAAAEKFEGFFIGQLLREMRRSTREMAGEDSVYRNTLDEDMLDIADVALGDSLASQHAFGVADAILRQLLPADGAAGAAAPTPTPIGASCPDATGADPLPPFKEAAGAVAWNDVTDLRTDPV